MRRIRALWRRVRSGLAGWSALLAAGCRGDPAAPAPGATPLAAFDVVWEAFDRTYPYFVLKGIDWPGSRVSFRGQAALATDASALNRLLVEMLAPLSDLHVALESPTGARTPTWIPPDRRNWDAPLWQRVVTQAGWRQVRINLGWARVGGVPYLAIGQWNSEQFTTADLDGILEQFRTEPALVIDVRPNSGGNDMLALEFARRFTDRPIATEVLRFRTGPGPGDLGNEITRTISPRGPWTYAGRTYVLSGRGVYSSNESFIAAMREIPGVTVVGDTTGGATANPVAVEYYQGWKVWVSRWYATLVDGQPIEGRGIAPDVHVPWSALGATDPVIDRAVTLARGGGPMGVRSKAVSDPPCWASRCTPAGSSTHQSRRW